MSEKREGEIKMVVCFAKEKEMKEEEEKGLLLKILNEEYFGVKELEQWLPWKAWTIRKKIRSGEIRGRRIKGKWFVSREDLYNFLRKKQKDQEKILTKYLILS